MMSACGRGWHLMKQGRSAALADWLAWPLVGPAAEPMAAQLFTALGPEDGGYAAAWTAVRAAVTEAWLVESGATHAIYTDGGGSGNIVSGGGLVGSSEGRPLPSFLVCTSGKSVLVPATVAALAVMLAYALSGDSELVH